MNSLSNKNLIRSDYLKLGFLVFVVSMSIALLLFTPALSAPLLLALVISMILSPAVARLERRSVPRTLSITLLFVCIGITLGSAGIWSLNRTSQQWNSLKEQTPEYLEKTTLKIKKIELKVRSISPLFKSFNLSDPLGKWTEQTALWFVDRGPELLGTLLSCLLIAPFFCFVFLAEGPKIKRTFFRLVPNRYFETLYSITEKSFSGISSYIRAKFLEAFLVTLLTWIGLAAIGVPYALMLALTAGVTNIIPYLGPILGALPGLIILGFDTTLYHLLWPAVIVYVGVNVIDMTIFFPIVVAKLVNLHPVILLIAVAIGQQYYGLVGMLISIPLTTTLKVILQEFYREIYKPSQLG